MVAPQWLTSMPWRTIGIIVSSVAALMIPGVGEWLLYDRLAVVGGELWRLLTAHIVHYSISHLVSNLLVLIFAAWLVEVRYQSDFWRVVVLSAVAIGIAVFVFEPGIARYAGASGVSLALLTYAALRGLGESARWRMVCILVLGIVLLKLMAEILFGWELVDWSQQAGFVTVTLSHVIGVGIGLLVWLVHAQRSVFAPGSKGRLTRLAGDL